MKTISIFFLAILTIAGCVAQRAKYDVQIDRLKDITSMPYIPEMSGDQAFWDLNKEKDKILPALIERLSDTTKTQANVPNFGGVYTIGDVCTRAIEELIKDFPTVDLIEPDVKEHNGYWPYWLFIRDYKNRLEFQRRVKDWYQKNRKNLVWEVDNKVYAVNDSAGGSSMKRPAGGYYVLKANR